MVKTKKYKNWLYYFDDRELYRFRNLDFSKPVYIHCKYIMKETQDVSNFIKPLFDKLAKYFEVDDRNFYIGNQEILGYYNDIRDGRIYIYMTN